MEQNNQRNSRKKLNSLILLVAFTAVMLIVSTYAWFSTQKNVTIGGLKGKVNVAEGLQISLDGSVWVNEINFADFDQAESGWTVKAEAGGNNKYFDAATENPTFQAPAGADGGITNVVPVEFLPVSTTGYSATNDGIGANLLKMYGGNVVNNNTDLESVALRAENSESGYYAFDLFVWNSSAASATEDILRLDSNSKVAPNNANTGIENSARVAFALYNNAGGDVSTATPLAQAAVIAGTSTGKTIKDVAIWEPNADGHLGSTVNTNNKLSLSTADLAKFPLASGTSKFGVAEKIPTYGLTSKCLELTDSKVSGIYKWDGADADTDGVLDNNGLAKQYTLQTPVDAATWTTPSNLVSTGKLETNPAATNTDFVLTASQYHKIRVYVWIEGQDPDCINTASLGGGLTIDIGLSKPSSEESGS